MSSRHSNRSPAVLALSETLGISKQRCITLLAASSGDVERAADIYYNQQQQQQQETWQQNTDGKDQAQRSASPPFAKAKEEEAMMDELKEDDRQHGEETAADDMDHEDGVDDDMPQLEPSTLQPLSLPPQPATLSPSSSAIPPKPPSVRPVRHVTAPTVSSSSSTPPLLSAARVKSESANQTATAATKSKPALFASSSTTSAAVKREPATAVSSSSHSASLSSHSGRPKAPSLFSAASQAKAEPIPHTSRPTSTAASSAERAAAVSSSSSPSSHTAAASATTPPRSDRVSVRIVDTINPDTPAITMRFPLDTTLHKVYAELERRGFPGVTLYHARSELSPELTPRELCLIDRCVLEMTYIQQQPIASLAGVAVGEKRLGESKEAEPAGAKKRRVEPSGSGKEEKVASDEADERLVDPLPPVDSSNQPAPVQPATSAVVEPVSLHAEHPVTFSRLRLASVAVQVRARTKVIAKRNHTFADLYAAARTVAPQAAMTVPSTQDVLLLSLIEQINSGQRHPIGVEVKWQRVQAAQPSDSSDSSAASDEQSTWPEAVLAVMRAALGVQPSPKQDKWKWLHTFDIDVYLLPVCVGWSITHMNQLLELLWGDKWQQLMSRVWSEQYQPGDGKPIPPMDQSSLLKLAQRFDYRATLDQSVLSSNPATVPPSLSSSSELIASGACSSPFPFRAPPPYESSETIGLRYLIQRERQKAVSSSWLSLSELEPHQLSIESCIGLSLRDYQQQSVLWMLGQELRDSVSEGFWIECRVDGQPLLYSPLFQQWRMGPIEPMRGGLLCDTMGLGKTIVSLALINLRPAPDEFYAASMAASYIPSPSHPVRSRATLIIAPVSLVPQWEAELRQHSLRPLRIYCFHGSRRETDARALGQYDVVLTTYGVLVSDTSGQRFKRRNGAASIFHRIEWWRVIVDEGHLLKATNTVQSRAAAAILSQQRHILTGTPMSSSVTDLRGLFLFLQCKLLADSPSFWSHLQGFSRATQSTTPPTSEDELVYRSMTFPPHSMYAVAEEMFARLCMRHTKDQPFNGRPTLAPLPPRSDSIHKVDFTPVQRAAYEELYTFARRKWDNDIRRGAANSSVIAGFSYLLPLRQVCAGTVVNMAEVRVREGEAVQRLEEAKRADESRRAHKASRQLPALPADVDENDDDDGDPSSNRQYAYATTLPYNELSDECVVCLSEFNMPLQTKCGHLFCAECIQSVIEMDPEAPCPQCRARVTRASLRRPRPRPKTPPPPPPPPPVKEESSAVPSASSDAATASSSATSTDIVVFDSKLEVVVAHILQLQRSDPSTKALVFSQFSSTLSYLSSRLTSLHVPVYRISGDMTMTARRRVLHSFNSSTAFSVFLLTPRVGAVGLTLTSASHCYIIEPALNWTLTEQAVGRVHRLGQQRPVVCVHYVMRDSVEERIEAVKREKKRAGAEEGGGSDAAAANAEDEESVGISSQAMVGLTSNAMGSVRKDGASYGLQELEKLFAR